MTEPCRVGFLEAALLVLCDWVVDVVVELMKFTLLTEIGPHSTGNR